MRNPAVCDTCGETSFTFLFNHHHQWKVQRCRGCGLAQIIPRPTRRDVAALYADDEAHFDPYIEQQAVHERYFREKLAVVQSLLAERTHASARRATDTILDIGCLTGVLLKEAGKLGIKATGVDISRDAVAYCKKHGLSAFHGTIADFAKKFPRKKFQAITAFEIIEHEYSPKMLVTTIYRMLAPGGITLVTTPNHGSWWRIVMGKYWPGYQHTEHLYFFDEPSLRALFIQAGFRTVTITHGDSRPFPLSFLFTRAADYFPAFGALLRLIGNSLKGLPITNPINPWDDLLVIARK